MGAKPLETGHVMREAAVYFIASILFNIKLLWKSV